MNKRWIIMALFAVALALVLWTDPGGIVTTVKEIVLRALGRDEEARLETLLPQVQDAVEELREVLTDKHGFDIFIGSSGRTQAQQEAVLEAGKSSTSHSWHLLGRALDAYPIDPLTGQPDLQGADDSLFRTMHAEAAALGFTGLAYNADGSRRTLTNAQGKPYWDGGHLQFQEGLTFAQAAAQQGVAIA